MMILSGAYSSRISMSACFIRPMSTQHLQAVASALRDDGAMASAHMHPFSISLTAASEDCRASWLSTASDDDGVSTVTGQEQARTLDIAKLVLEQYNFVVLGQLWQKRKDDGGLACTEEAGEDGYGDRSHAASAEMFIRLPTLCQQTPTQATPPRIEIVCSYRPSRMGKLQLLPYVHLRRVRSPLSSAWPDSTRAG